MVEPGIIVGLQLWDDLLGELGELRHPVDDPILLRYDVRNTAPAVGMGA